MFRILTQVSQTKACHLLKNYVLLYVVTQLHPVLFRVRWDCQGRVAWMAYREKVFLERR